MPVFGGPDPTPSTSSSSLPIAPPAPSPPPSSSSLAPSSPTRTLSPAAAAALARAQPAPRPTSRAEAHSARLDQEGGEEFRPDRKDLLAYHRVLDSQFLPNVSKTQAVETLSTLHTILSNLLSPPAPSQAHKYRHIRLSNPLIQRIILTPASGSAKDFLVLCGWKREVKEFEEALVWRGGEGQVYRVRCGRLVVEGKLRAAKEAEERERRYKESEKEAEAARKEKALLAYEEDRLSRAERDERERLVREARAALPSPPVIPRPTGPSPYLPRAPPSSLPFHAAAAADPEAGTDDPPPSYGESARTHSHSSAASLPFPGAGVAIAHRSRGGRRLRSRYCTDAAGIDEVARRERLCVRNGAGDPSCRQARRRDCCASQRRYRLGLSSRRSAQDLRREDAGVGCGSGLDGGRHRHPPSLRGVRLPYEVEEAAFS
ncbi:RHTO0S07e03246g1_1 [Rhodotorula toruloides]|uniref:RHTO0S07e03246g1_1 n=1 Tax=Rhodotorula toruloides TaxID=5286 RepID=A0A061AZQ3_RHOTO|nr:RHTO0S07e03246g1_1 [Rhodotorula toruloides]